MLNTDDALSRVLVLKFAGRSQLLPVMMGCGLHMSPVTMLSFKA